MQKEGQDNTLYRVLHNYVQPTVLANKNKAKSWTYGYDFKNDLIVISKDGTVGEVIEIEGLKIALPIAPKECLQRHKKKEEQYWERFEIPNELNKIQTIFQWNEKPS